MPLTNRQNNNQAGNNYNGQSTPWCDMLIKQEFAYTRTYLLRINKF